MNILNKEWLQNYPRTLFRALGRISEQRHVRLYLAGGSVRDWLLGKKAHDLDLAVEVDAFGCGHDLVSEIGGSLVPLDTDEDVARVVWQGFSIDLAGFREGVKTIQDDLWKRDFTINAMAVPFDPNWADETCLKKRVELIDPTGGFSDLEKRKVRFTSPDVFTKDPLRLLRAYRFTACLSFVLDARTEQYISDRVALIKHVAAERLAYELELIMASRQASEAIRAMNDSGLLEQLFPELLEGVGLTQPASHHLDVFEHSLAALNHMEKIQQQPDRYFPGHGDDMANYLAGSKRKIWLKWSALFHDLGKPCTHLIRPDKGDRITFYSHDKAGAEKFGEIAQRFKWCSQDTRQVARFIEMHMWPFHLNNARQKTALTPKAYLRLVKAIGQELSGLFLLAMADSLAGQGADKPLAMEESLLALYEEVDKVYRESIKPVLESPRLLNGHDLQKRFGLAPGPVFREIFDNLEKAQVAGTVRNRKEAFEWVKSFLAK